MVHIDKESATPYYRQLREQLRDLIVGGILKTGAKLPPTRQLAEELGLNRNTVLTAYEELEADGLVRSHVGQGTFVADPADYQEQARPGIRRYAPRGTRLPTTHRSTAPPPAPVDPQPPRKRPWRHR